MNTPAPSSSTLLSPANPTGRADEFRPVAGGEPEVTSATVMLIVAYALFWALVFAFVVRTWQNQRRTERRLSELERQLKHHFTSE
jgi:CcmD family protein